MWADVTNENNQSSSKESEVKFLKLPEGTVKIRVLDDEPKSRWRHWIPAPANNGKGISVNCIGKGCPLCEENKVAKKATGKNKYNTSMSHIINVLVISITEKGKPAKEVNEVMLLDKGNTIFGNMADLISQGCNLKERNINITRKGKNFNDITYSVMPVLVDEPLTVEQNQISLDTYDLDEVDKNLSLDELKTLMNGGSLQPAENVQANQTQAQAPSYTPLQNGMNVDFSQALQD